MRALLQLFPDRARFLLIGTAILVIGSMLVFCRPRGRENNQPQPVPTPDWYLTAPAVKCGELVLHAPWVCHDGLLASARYGNARGIAWSRETPLQPDLTGLTLVEGDFQYYSYGDRWYCQIEHGSGWCVSPNPDGEYLAVRISVEKSPVD